MSSTSYTNARKHLIQQKIDKICQLKEEIQRDVQLLAKNEIRDGYILLQTNDRKFFRSKYKQTNKVLETVLLKLLSISNSLHQEESCSDSDTSFDESELNVTPLKCNDITTLEAVNTPEADVDQTISNSATMMVTSSPIPFVSNYECVFEDHSRSLQRTESTVVVGSLQVSELSNGLITNREDDTAARNDGATSLAVETAFSAAENESTESLIDGNDFPPGYDADFKHIMSKLSELKKKVPQSSSNEAVAVRDLLAQQVKNFFVKISDVEEVNGSDAHSVRVSETSSDTLVVESDTIQNVESTPNVDDVDGSALEEVEESVLSYRDIAGFEVKVGTELKCYITHVESPSLFYVRPLDVDTQEILIDNLNQHYDSRYREQVTEKPFLGMCCCVLEIEKSTWSRAIVTEIHDSESSNLEVSVFYVDYGHTGRVSLFKLKKLDETFRRIPRQAVSCCLLDVEPPEERTEYKEEEIIFFKELVRGFNVRVTFCSLGPVRSVDVIQLYDELEDVDGPLNVAEILMKAGMISYRGQVQPPTLEIPAEKTSKELVTDSFAAADVELNIFENECLSSSHASDVNVDNCRQYKLRDNGDKKTISFVISPTASRLCKSLPVFKEGDIGTENDNKIEHKSNSTQHATKETKDVDLLGRFDIPLLKLNAKKSDFLQGMTETVNSPTDFYIHFANNEVSKIDILNKEINESIFNTEAPPLILDPARIAVGSYWCCRSSGDGRWYRGKILEVRVEDSSSSTSRTASASSDEEATDKKKKKRRRRQKAAASSILPKASVHVFYIDYGNFEWIGTDSLRMIYKKFCKLPALAVKCRMAHVMPKNMNEKWCHEAKESFKSWVDNKTMKVQFFDDVNTVLPDVALNVYLWDLSDIEGKILNEELVKHGFATSDVFFSGTSSTITSNGSDSREIKNLETWDPMGEDFKSDRNSYAVDIDDAGVALTGWKANDERDICTFYQRNKPCPRGLGCRYKHIRPATDGITTDIRIISNINESVKLPPLEQFVVVIVTALEHPGKFFVNFPLTSEPLADLSEIPDWAPPSENLYVLNEELQKDYSRANNKRQGSYLNPAKGEIIVAKYSENNCWYRARVIDFKQTTAEATVYFVDFGNEEIVSYADIQEIQPRFLHLPIQAVECSLAGIKPCNDQLQWCEKSRCIFERLLPTNCPSLEELSKDKTTGNLTIKVKDILGDRLIVNLYNMSSNSNVIINDALVHAGVACYVT